MKKRTLILDREVLTSDITPDAGVSFIIRTTWMFFTIITKEMDCDDSEFCVTQGCTNGCGGGGDTGSANTCGCSGLVCGDEQP